MIGGIMANENFSANMYSELKRRELIAYKNGDEVEIEEIAQKRNLVEMSTLDEYLKFMRYVIGGKEHANELIITSNGSLSVGHFDGRNQQLEQYTFSGAGKKITILVANDKPKDWIGNRMSNTHVYDMGKRGMKNEIEVCNNMTIDYYILCSQRLHDLEHGQLREWDCYLETESELEL